MLQQKYLKIYLKQKKIEKKYGNTIEIQFIDAIVVCNIKKTAIIKMKENRKLSTSKKVIIAKIYVFSESFVLKTFIFHFLTKS